MLISFHGANREVTGSCHLIEAKGKRILIDCGLYQGKRELEEENAEDFGFDPESIDIVLLTHAHLDHCGRIPLLVNRGFHGEIITTAASRELARVIMLDAAHLQEEEAERHARQAQRHGKKTLESLYDSLDALNALDQFGRTASYGQAIELATDLTATFYDAGHILGSASIRIEESGSEQQSVIFSGDIGNNDRPILRNPQIPPAANAVVMETTYGDRLHKQLEPSIEELYSAINNTITKGGNVIIPTFALERAQEILFYLREGVDKGILPQALPVFLDSPMAISATTIFRRHPECYDSETYALFENDKDPFQLPGLKFTRQTADSMALNNRSGGSIIMAGSGMCTGGRVRHHLRHNLWRKDSSIVFVGFAAPGTLARIIVDGAKEVKLFGEHIPVNAQLYTINGFSAHADQAELLAWHQALKPGKTILVHGEEEAMKGFSQHLKSTEIHMPLKGESINLLESAFPA